ncbi:hypothetical protein DO72_4832 [Burkholderia pseudomallei]|nr:hypothetical protein DO72_4832 [Burkholderia pseudomallei]
MARIARAPAATGGQPIGRSADRPAGGAASGARRRANGAVMRVGSGSARAACSGVTRRMRSRMHAMRRSPVGARGADKRRRAASRPRCGSMRESMCAPGMHAPAGPRAAPAMRRLVARTQCCIAPDQCFAASPRIVGARRETGAIGRHPASRLASRRLARHLPSDRGAAQRRSASQHRIPIRPATGFLGNGVLRIRSLETGFAGRRFRLVRQHRCPTKPPASSFSTGAPCRCARSI